MNNRREKWFRFFIYWWILAFACAAFIQGYSPEMVARHTDWGFAPGWQHEIAIWNMGMILVLIGVLRSRLPVSKVIPGLCALFLLLGLNHLWAVISNPEGHGYAIVILNFIPIVAVILVLIFTRRKEKKSK